MNVEHPVANKIRCYNQNTNLLRERRLRFQTYLVEQGPHRPAPDRCGTMSKTPYAFSMTPSLNSLVRFGLFGTFAADLLRVIIQK